MGNINMSLYANTDVCVDRVVISMAAHVWQQDVGLKLWQREMDHALR